MSHPRLPPDAAIPDVEVGAAVRSGPTSFEAGAGAAAEALASITRHRPSAVLVFASEQELEAALRGVRSVVGEAPILGATAAGEICTGAPRGSVVVAVLASRDGTSAAGAGHAGGGPEAFAVLQAARGSEVASPEAQALRRSAREELEVLVQERTADLRAANESLAREVEHRRRAEALAQRHERASRTLGACNEALVRASDERQLLEDVCRIIVEVGGYRLAWVGYAEKDERRSVRPAGAWGEDHGYVAAVAVVWSDTERGRGPIGTAIRTGRPALARRISADPAFAVWRAEAERRGFASMVALPLVCEGETLGALAIYSGDVDALGDDRELKLLAELAADLAFGINVVRGRAERTRMQARLVEADRLAAVGTLAAGVAHEINNPLAYLLGGLEFVVSDLAALMPGRLDEVRLALGEMRAGGERIRHIVRDLKTFSRNDDEARTVLDPRALADSAIHMASHEILQRARLVRELGPIPAVHVNEARLGQVLLNLLVNAAQAIPDGAPNANEIRVSTRTDDAGRAVIEISDTGTGIAPELRKRIFEPFFTTKPHGVGTGLGLWISRNLVAAAGGEIEVESVVGKGTAFKVVLPPAGGPPCVEPSATPSPGPAPRGRVLVVDDDPLVANAIRRALASEHEVVVETSPRAALARVEAGERFGAIVCDLMMPEMTGMELHAAVARASPADGARVVFVTGGAFTPEATRYLEAVRNPRLEKPFEAAALLALVRNVMERPAESRPPVATP